MPGNHDHNCSIHILLGTYCIPGGPNEGGGSGSHASKDVKEVRLQTEVWFKFLGTKHSSATLIPGKYLEDRKQHACLSQLNPSTGGVHQIKQRQTNLFSQVFGLDALGSVGLS